MSKKPANLETPVRKTTTETRIINALFSLMQTDPIEKITVLEVCALAKVNRSTFYNHFLDIYDVRDHYEKALIETIGSLLPPLMLAKIMQNDDFSTEKIEQALGPHFDKLNVLLNGGDPNFPTKLTALARSSFISILGIDTFSERQEYVFHALAGMQLSLLGYWLRSGRTIPLDDLVQLMQDLIEYGPKAAMLSGMTALSPQ